MATAGAALTEVKRPARRADSRSGRERGRVGPEAAKGVPRPRRAGGGGVTAPSGRMLAVTLAVALLALLPAGALWVASDPPVPVLPILAEMEARGAGVLDGMQFAGQIGPAGQPADVEDAWTFEHGMFVSRECRERCGYLPSAYFTRRHDGAIEFTSRSYCPQKNSTIVWRGVIRGDVIEGRFEWTSERWYWTLEREFWFRGSRTPRAVADGGA